MSRERTLRTHQIKQSKVHFSPRVWRRRFYYYQYEKPGDTSIYGNPLSGDEVGSFGIYEIEAITEHNFPDNPGDDGADLNTAFTTYTVKPLFTALLKQTDMPIGDDATCGSRRCKRPRRHRRTRFHEGDLWFNTNETELTLYVYDGSVWVPAAPPVSLDGIDSRVSYLSRWSSHNSRL